MRGLLKEGKTFTNFKTMKTIWAWPENYLKGNKQFILQNAIIDCRAYFNVQLMTISAIVKCSLQLYNGNCAVVVIGADSTGATGAFAPVLARVLGREYGFAPVPFGHSKYIKL